VEPRAGGALWKDGTPTLRGTVESISTDGYTIPDYVVVAKEFWAQVERKTNDPGTIGPKLDLKLEHAVSTTTSFDIEMELGIVKNGLSAKFSMGFGYRVTVADTTTKEFTWQTVSDPVLTCDNVLWERYLTIHVVEKANYNKEVAWPLRAVTAVIKDDDGHKWQEYLISPQQGSRCRSTISITS
jgi:hypothetical protein